MDDPNDMCLSRLIHTASDLAVYASQAPLRDGPRKTRFRLVASLCRAGFSPAGSHLKGFRSVDDCLHRFPLSQASLTHIARHLRDGAEVLQVLARDAQIPLEHVDVTVRGTIDRERQPRTDVTVFTSVKLTLRLRGPNPAQAAELVAGFQRRCPVYGSLAVASGHIEVEII